MKSTWMTFAVSLFLASAVAQAEAVRTDALPASANQTITFAENSVPTFEHKVQKNGLGVTSHLNDGFGIFYERGLGERLRAHSEIYYNGKEHSSMPNFDKSNVVGAGEFKVRDQVSVSIGVDRFFNLTDDGRWSVLAGAAVMYARGRAEAKFFPTLCSWLYCGYNPNVVLKSQAIEDQAFVTIFRAGVRYGGIKIMGHKSDFAVILNMQAARTPQAEEFQSPDGRSVASGLGNVGSLALESSLTF